MFDKQQSRTHPHGHDDVQESISEDGDEWWQAGHDEENGKSRIQHFEKTLRGCCLRCLQASAATTAALEKGTRRTRRDPQVARPEAGPDTLAQAPTGPVEAGEGRHSENRGREIQ